MLRHSIAMAMYKKGIPISYIRNTDTLEIPIVLKSGQQVFTVQ